MKSILYWLIHSRLLPHHWTTIEGRPKWLPCPRCIVVYLYRGKLDKSQQGVEDATDR